MGCKNYSICLSGIQGVAALVGEWGELLTVVLIGHIRGGRGS